jgi:hypothetical protein
VAAGAALASTLGPHECSRVAVEHSAAAAPGRSGLVAPVVADHEVEAYVVNIYMRSSECVRVRRLASRFVADTQLDGGVVLPVIYRGGQRSARAWCFAWNDKGVLGAMRATGGFGPDSCVRRMEVV